MLTPTQLTNLKAAAIKAHKCEVSEDVPAEVILAQWVLESGWGNHAPGNNCFGIKEYKGCVGTQLLRTYEYFTPQEATQFVDKGNFRSATRVTQYDSGNPDENGRSEYKCQDWFAVFDSLQDCFSKRCELFQSGKYKPLTVRYNKDKNLVGFIRGMSSIYATDPNYADTIVRIISKPEVIDAIKEARLSVKV